MTSPRTIELLAPARNCEIARQAIIHGADAVYIGADAFGARAAATNSVGEIGDLCGFAHRFNARVYVTLNTIIYDDELEQAKNLVWQLYRAGVDALIVQDMALLKMDLPPIALHASTQCDTRSADKARFLNDCGFSQIVLARELSLNEISQICSTVDVPVEVFVHGALCVSYSGDCQASFLATGRSANRGECAQICRLPYRLTDSEGNVFGREAHYLSLRDMNRLNRLADLADAGVSSFKIEGRLKDIDYVKTTVAAYSRALDHLVASSGGRYRRLSSGRVDYKIDPDLTTVFNRGYTSYFLDGKPSTMASLRTPKWAGVEVASVVSADGKSIKVNAKFEIHNGDGLTYFDANGRFCGFRVNRVEGSIIYPASDVKIVRGTPLYRNRDVVSDRILASEQTNRRIPLKAQLRRVNNNYISLKLTDDRDVYVELMVESPFQTARSLQRQNRYRIISKLGDTIYTLDDLDDMLADDDFIPASLLAEFRRSAIDALDSARLTAYRFDYRRNPKEKITPFKSSSLDRHDNVANHLAAEFYRSNGFDVKEKATEVIACDPKCDYRVMTTRYCLRCELGACLKTPNAKRLPTPLFLKSTGISYRLDFDCTNCRMHVIAPALK